MSALQLIVNFINNIHMKNWKNTKANPESNELLNNRIKKTMFANKASFPRKL